MGYSLESKMSSRQPPTTKVVREKILSPQANRNIRFQDIRKVENPFGQPYIDRRPELRQSAGDGPVVHLKSSENRQKQWSGSSTNKDDELVKHMSNLPGYLQQVERGENLQEKALNFGVLDWDRLEKWKDEEKHIPARGNSKASSSSSNSSFIASGSSTISSTAQTKTLTRQRKKPTSHGYLNSSSDERLSQGVRQARGKVKQQEFETAPRSTLDGKKNIRWKDKSFSRSYSEIKLDRGKGKESDQMATSEKETSSSDSRKYRSPISLHDTMSAKDRGTKTRVEDEFNLGPQYCRSEHQSIVLLLPKHFPQKSCSESFHLSETRTSFDGKFAEPIGNRFSDCFSPEELHSVEAYSEIPHSCPLPVSVTTNNESEMKRHSVNSQSKEAQSDRSHMHQPNEIPFISSRGKCLEESKSNIEQSASTTIETSKRSDQDIAEQPAAKGRHPSPNRRFSFSLGKMTRSFSFKEGLAVPQLSSTYTTVKSGPVRSEASAGLDGRDKVNASSRARSSPLRRLLDPLLKPRGAHASETVQLSKGNLDSVSIKPMNTSEFIQDKKHEGSSVQALLQLIIKNGLPLFKLVVDNSSDILAAALKKLPTSEKDDSSLIYAFYSVHEFKKKSGGWINQGSKEKSCGFGYNIIGQMKVSSSCPPDSTGQNSKDQYESRESVLYSVDLGQADKETPEYIPKSELATIVVKNPCKKNGDGEQSDRSSHYTQKGFTECSLEDTCDPKENENSESTIVILPGGIHGLPNNGEPSPLIYRWRSGSCDCGGWDVGCKLRILTNQDQSSKILRPSISCSATDRLDLFVQGGYRENKPIFSLAPLKNGLYSVEYNASISLLQAFSICVAVISSQKSADISEVNNLWEAKRFPEPMTESGTMKTPTTYQEVPAKYVPCPPPSPVGRV